MTASIKSQLSSLDRRKNGTHVWACFLVVLPSRAWYSVLVHHPIIFPFGTFCWGHWTFWGKGAARLGQGSGMEEALLQLLSFLSVQIYNSLWFCMGPSLGWIKGWGSCIKKFFKSYYIWFFAPHEELSDANFELAFLFWLKQNSICQW